MLGWGRGPLLRVGSGWVFALRDGLLNRIGCLCFVLLQDLHSDETA